MVLSGKLFSLLLVEWLLLSHRLRVLDLEGVGFLSLMHTCSKERASEREAFIHCFETRRPDDMDQFLLPSPLETFPKEQSLGFGPDSQLSIADKGKYFQWDQIGYKCGWSQGAQSFSWMTHRAELFVQCVVLGSA